mmetsp:Transcript_26766/g.53522  ORF Transcript_26766/g.53522 Transcript_26766/m.53522 type:complete len:95 (+) Transcript_26766:575-859(+)
MIEEVEHHKEEEVEDQKRGRRSHVLFTGRCSDVARWATEWQIAKVVEDHEEGEEEEKEPIHSLGGGGGARHEEEGEGTYSFGIVLCLLMMIIPS